MKSWPPVELSPVQPPKKPLRVYSTQARSKIEIPLKNRYQIYVCGITPYDATHLGHAATYLTFDIAIRYLLAQGAEVNYIQNITDIDDPLLERAIRDGVDWQVLAHSQIDLFRGDMQALRILPPTHYEGAVAAIPDVISAIAQLEAKGTVYDVDSDKYFRVHADPNFGSESHLSHSQMLKLFADRGGDPDRKGKQDALDALLWLSKRPNEPSWDSPFGAGRPGWHIECAAIALKYAAPEGEYILDIQGGGSDLIFPHHEMSASQVRVLTGKPFARAYVHAGLIGLDGEKMSKSKGNLIFVSKLLAAGVSPMSIRWALLKRPFRTDYIWQRTETDFASFELDALQRKLNSRSIPPTDSLISDIYDFIADDLNTSAAINAINDWVASSGQGGKAGELINVLDSLLGIALPL